MHECDWSDFVSAMVDLYDPRGATDYTKKSSTPAISPAIYPDGARRANEHVLGWGGWIGLDIDNDGPIWTTVDDVVAALEAVPCDYLIYTTMKATPSRHRLRVIFPLSRELGRDEVEACWAAVCRMFNGLGPDPSCKDLSRIYTAPSLWQPRNDGNGDPFNEFRFRIDGDVLDIDAVLAAYPPPVVSAPSPVIRRASTVSIDPPRPIPREGKKALPADCSIYASPVVTASMIEDYVNAPKGTHHTGLYRFMTRVVGRAVAKGYSITADDLIALAQEVDDASPIKTNPSRWSRIRYEAERALQFCGAR
jgi:hypothetical protein